MLPDDRPRHAAKDATEASVNTNQFRVFDKEIRERTSAQANRAIISSSGMWHSKTG